MAKKQDFILICETFLTIINDNMFHIDGYNFVCRNRTNPQRGGGVGIYIKSNILPVVKVIQKEYLFIDKYNEHI